MKNIFLYIILLLLIFGITPKENLSNSEPQKEAHHFCGANYLKFKINPPVIPRNENNNLKSRKLSTTQSPIRIFVDTTNIEKEAEKFENMTDKVPIIKNALIKAVEGMQKLIEVEQMEFNIYSNLSVELLKENLINQWDEQINDRENMSLFYDYILFARFEVESDGFPPNVLAAAMPILFGENEELGNRPIAGVMMVTNHSMYLEKENVEKYFSIVFIHELTHALGFLSGCFKYFPGGEENTIGSKIDDIGITRYFIKTPKVIEFAKKFYGCDKIDGIEVEDQGTGGSAGSHWEGRVLLGEYMTSEYYEEEITISEFTLALLEDSGWYKANYYTGGLFRFGKNKGCEFLNKYCLFYDFYANMYYTDFNDEYFGLDMMNYPSCTTGRQSRAYNLFKYYPPEFIGIYTNKLPKDFTSNYYYFGGYLYSADFCPVNYRQENEYNNTYFVGNCKYGNGNYGSNLYYYISPEKTENLHPNSELPEELGEKYSDNSFCMMTNLIPENSDSKTSMYGTIFHPMCYPSFCSSSSLTVLIYDQYIVCPREGGNIEVRGYKGRLHCPDYNLICTGTVVCNDLFDCIEKESEPKENTFTYDYIKIATQRYTDIYNGNTYIGWENADDGVCPKMCVQCLEKKKCKRCLVDYNLIGVRENDDQPIICDNTIDITKGYYLKDNIYYRCHSNCLKCSGAPISDTEMNCDECIEGLYYHKTTKNCDDTKEEETEEEEEYPIEPEEEEQSKEEETEEEYPIEPEEEEQSKEEEHSHEEESEEEYPIEPEEEDLPQEEESEEVNPEHEEEQIPEDEGEEYHEEEEKDDSEKKEEEKEEEDEEREEEEESGNRNKKQNETEGNAFIIIIISVIAAVVIIAVIIIVFFYLKRDRVESDKIDTLMTDNRETPLYEK